MSQTHEEATGDGAALEAARARHPSSQVATGAGCSACDADVRGTFRPCAEHRVFALHRTYTAQAEFGPRRVTVTESVLGTGELLATWDLQPLSSDAACCFSWGYAGRGPILLADAVLADALGEEASAIEAITFKDEVIAEFDTDQPLHLTRVDVLAWVYDFRGHKGGSALRPPRRAIDVEIANAIIPTLRRAD